MVRKFVCRDWSHGQRVGRWDESPTSSARFKLTGRSKLVQAAIEAGRERGRGAQWRPGVGFVGKKGGRLSSPAKQGYGVVGGEMRVHAKTSERGAGGVSEYGDGIRDAQRQEYGPGRPTAVCAGESGDRDDGGGRGVYHCSISGFFVQPLMRVVLLVRRWVRVPVNNRP